jgi:hypothetical protein
MILDSSAPDFRLDSFDVFKYVAPQLSYAAELEQLQRNYSSCNMPVLATAYSQDIATGERAEIAAS